MTGQLSVQARFSFAFGYAGEFVRHASYSLACTCTRVDWSAIFFGCWLLVTGCWLLSTVTVHCSLLTSILLLTLFSNSNTLHNVHLLNYI